MKVYHWYCEKCGYSSNQDHEISKCENCGSGEILKDTTEVSVSWVNWRKHD